MDIKESCIQRIAQDKIAVVRDWQRTYCNNNVTACAILSFLEYNHNWKLEQYRRTGNPNDLLQWHTNEDMADGILGIGQKDRIRDAKLLLVKLGAISLHQNPKKPDCRKTFYLFHADTINHWINTVYLPGLYVSKVTKTPVDNYQKTATETQKIKPVNNQSVNKTQSAQGLTPAHRLKTDNVPSDNRQCFSIQEKTLVKKTTTSEKNNWHSNKFPPTQDGPRSLKQWQHYFIDDLAFKSSIVNHPQCQCMMLNWLTKRHTSSMVIAAIQQMMDRKIGSPIQSPLYFKKGVDSYIQQQCVAIKADSPAYRRFEKQPTVVLTSPEKFLENINKAKEILSKGNDVKKAA